MIFGNFPKGGGHLTPKIMVQNFIASSTEYDLDRDKIPSLQEQIFVASYPEREYIFDKYHFPPFFLFLYPSVPPGWEKACPLAGWVSPTIRENK